MDDVASSLIGCEVCSIPQTSNNLVLVVSRHDVGPRLYPCPAQDGASPVPPLAVLVASWQLPTWKPIKENITESHMKIPVMLSSVQVDELINGVIDLIFLQAADNALLAVDHRFDQHPVQRSKRAVARGIALGLSPLLSFRCDRLHFRFGISSHRLGQLVHPTRKMGCKRDAL